MFRATDVRQANRSKGKRYYGPGNHGSRGSAALRAGIEEIQRRSAKWDGVIAGAFRGAERHLAGPGAPEVRGGIQANDEGAEEIYRGVEPAFALPAAESPAHRGISEPALSRPAVLMSQRANIRSVEAIQAFRTKLLIYLSK